MKFIHLILQDIFISKDMKKDKRKGCNQRQLSKEFARQWLINKDFQVLKGQQMPDIDLNLQIWFLIDIY